MRILKALLMLSALAALVGCTETIEKFIYVYANPTVSGTISFLNLGVSGNVVVSITDGNNSYDVTVAVPQTGSPTQQITYSVANVPLGTYAVSVSLGTVTSGAKSTGTYYVLNGDGNHHTLTIDELGASLRLTASNVAVTSNLQFEVIIEGYGG
jgi:hypothetical protein